jgi:hypothetical protein
MERLAASVSDERQQPVVGRDVRLVVDGFHVRAHGVVGDADPLRDLGMGGG